MSEAKLKELDCSAREHLAMLRRAWHELGCPLKKKEHEKFMVEINGYLRAHERQDADFADLGRPFKYQYNACRQNDQGLPPAANNQTRLDK